MQSARREIAIKVAAVTVFVNACVIIVASFLTEREEWGSDLPVVMILATALTVGVSWTLARQVQKSHALALELQRLVDRDRLTDVATRDFFFSEMEKRPNAHGVVLMVDLDRFKNVNDTHGHLTGDAVIRDVASLLAGNIRAEDMICRFGGEEFLIFLNRQDETTGASIGERLRAAVERRIIPVSQDETLRATISIGAAQMNSVAELTKAISLADDALYVAKEGGRNRLVVSWRDEVQDHFDQVA
ncbi:diguanylate cyclase (GGDEF)-like protein [Shimia isoporae]|uniref:diguanylate cyclase n=1 Tax=Shimia isoporae TaxID=647720 RepID=A0A4R1NTN6_9RHOB|nr:GGDEF domain-containing protein [Shimia isoporae]TCL08638.1 diguanylate cyclase (GGDEF)-like protein [Shimia isoporae]